MSNYRYCIKAVEKVCTKYWVEAPDEETAMEKLNAGEYADCCLDEYVSDDLEDVSIVSKEEIE